MLLQCSAMVPQCAKLLRAVLCCCSAIVLQAPDALRRAAQLFLQFLQLRGLHHQLLCGAHDPRSLTRAWSAAMTGPAGFLLKHLISQPALNREYYSSQRQRYNLRCHSEQTSTLTSESRRQLLIM